MARHRTIALLMWGDLFEDFFDTIDVSFESFRTELSGGWLFGYVAALATADVDTVLVYVSGRVRRTQRFVHEPTGASVCVLPSPRRHRIARWLHRHVPRRKAFTALVSYLSLPVAALARELRLQWVEAIVLQEYEHPRFDVAVALGRLLRLPVYASFQGGDAPGSRVERLLRPLTVRAASGIIIGSGRERERVRATYGVPPERIAAIPNGMDIPNIEPGGGSARMGDSRPVGQSEARARLDIPADARVVGWHGRVTIHRKGLDLLLDAWDIVCRERPDEPLLLLLVGTGDDAPALHRRLQDRPASAASTGWGSTGVAAAGRVRWRDDYLTDRDELGVYLSAADVYVLPSRHEGFPVAPIEAMAASLPVVAADAPGVRDILPLGEESGGIVVAREDIPALARALGELLDNPQRCQDMGRRARLRVEENYSLERVGMQLRAFLFPPEVPTAR